VNLGGVGGDLLVNEGRGCVEFVLVGERMEAGG
jgi:hypothetical protein